MGQGMFSIGGIASGLDTETIITQLMALEKLPVTKLQQSQTQLRTVDTAWQQVNTKLSALRTKIDGLKDPAKLAGLTSVTSSNTDAVAVTAGGTAGSGSLSFRVTQLAQGHQVVSDAVADGTPLTGTFTVTAGDTTTSIELDGSGDLADLARQLNAANGGFRASVVTTGDGGSRLILESTATGQGSALTVGGDVDGLGDGAFATIQDAQDAHVQLGSGASAVTLVRSSNTIDDLVPGATVTLKKVTDGPVTVSASRDVDGAVAAIKGYVDQLNDTIKTLADMTRYNSASNTAGPLQGDPAARQLLASLRSAVTSPIGGGFGTAHDLGIGVDRYGVVTLDETKLRDALAADFDRVANVFSGQLTSTNALASNVSGAATTTAGTYQFEVTAAATIGSVTGSAYSPPTEPTTLRIVVGSRTVDVVLDDSHATAEDAAQAINAALTAAGAGAVTASAEAGALHLADSRYGTANRFTISVLDADGEPTGGDAWGLSGEHRGTDAAGMLVKADGTELALEGSGRTLRVPSGAAEGLSFRWDGDAPGITTIRYHTGLVGTLDRTLAAAEGSNGIVARAREGISSQIKVYQDRIDAFDIRLESRETTLRRQFTAMEVALQRLHSQGDWMASQLQALNAQMAANRK